MSGADSAKKILTHYNQERYREFTLNNDMVLALPEISSVPWVGASKRRDSFKKILSHPGQPNHVKFITKNDEPHAFLWQTNAEKLKKATRWGIIKTHSMTGKVIATLGQYRVVAHQRVAKGMVSNSQAIKLKLLDLFQDRFEALEEVESLVNRSHSTKNYKEALSRYIQKLEEIRANLDTYFTSVDQSGFDKNAQQQLFNDIQADINRTQSYFNSLDHEENIISHAQARGPRSVIEFVKQQMIHGLYELQGINQDLSYNKKRYFALTRGELNDFIEDSRKEIDDHQADLCNAVNDKHHGIYSADKNALLTYDFSDDHLTPAREREILLAISFIEEWDQLKHNKGKQPVVSNKSGEEKLDIIAATKWKTHRNVQTLFKSLGFYIMNMFKGMLFVTHPWEEESWKSKNFRLVAARLRAFANPNEPMWKKPFQFLKKIADAIVDIGNGVYDFGAELVIRMPVNVVNDWQSSQTLPSLKSTMEDVSKSINQINLVEKERLAELLKRCKYVPKETSLRTSQLARVDYALTAGEQNDILTAMARGLNGFGSFFSHTIYAKDPVGGLLFTAAYAVGAGAIYLPSFTSSLFGSAYVNWFSHFSYSMGSSKLAAVVAGGSTQAELFATGWDSFVHGPSGMAMGALYQAGEDPLTVGAYFAAAYGLGYILANGVMGHPIPWLSEHLRADLGTTPEAGYPIIGAKIAVMLYEALTSERSEHNPQPELSVNGKELLDSLETFYGENQTIIDRFCLAHWLSTHAKTLPKLEPQQLFAISRQIDALFSKQDSKSLHKLLYPESHFSIAFHIFSIPLSYIPRVLRVGVSLCLSLAAWVDGNPHPLEPARRATSHLVDQVKKDLSRLIVFGTHVIYLPYTMLSALVKMTAYLATMAIGRVAGLFDGKPAHALHRMFAGVHVFFRHIGEFFYPVKVLKNVASAHPTHTIKNSEESYVKLLVQTGYTGKPPVKNESVLDTSSHILFPTVKKIDQNSPVIPNVGCVV